MMAECEAAYVEAPAGVQRLPRQNVILAPNWSWRGVNSDVNAK